MTNTTDTTATITRVTTIQRRNLANLLLSRGFDQLTEFYGEIVEDHCWTAGVEVPTYEVAVDICRKWSAQVIKLADKI